MPLIIDTYNVLHVTGVLPGELAVEEPEGLARLIGVSRFASEAVWLICDGVPRGASRLGRIVIEGAGHGRSADDHLLDFLKRSSAPRRVTVVTSDRAILKRAKTHGAACLKSEEFLAMLGHDAEQTRRKKPQQSHPRKSVPLNSREVAGWTALFAITAEQAAIQGAPALPPRTAATSRANDRALEQFLEATKDLADPLSILDALAGRDLLDALGSIDDATLTTLMQQHEPSVLKDGARIGGRKRKPNPRGGA